MKTNGKTVHYALSIISAAVTFALYIPSLSNGFVEWDDQAYVYENPGIRALDITFLKNAFFSASNSNWHPLTIISYGIDYGVWGLDPFGYHLVNVIIHSINTFLVFILAARLSEIFFKDKDGAKAGLRTTATAMAAALLFGIHPLHVESVAWISERKDVLSGLFYILSVISYLNYSDPGRAKKKLHYLLSVLFFVLALMGKPMAVTLPVTLLILDYCPLDKFKAQGLLETLREKIPFIPLSAISSALTVWAQHADKAMPSLQVSPFSERFSVAVRGFIFYLKKTIYPTDLAPFYVRPFQGEFYDGHFFLAFFLLAAITAASVILAKRFKPFAAAWMYYIATLLPVIGIVQVSNHAAADRYAYLPLLGPFIVASAGVSRLFKPPYKKTFAFSGVVAIAAIFAALSFLAFRQIKVWRDSVSLWTQEIRVFPVAQAYAKRAAAYEKMGMFKEAAEDYTVVINNTGEGRDVLLVKRGIVLLEAGVTQLAIRDFTDAISLNPRNPAGHNNMGNAYRRLGDTSSAIASYLKASELDPANPAIYYNLGNAYNDAGQPRLAGENLGKASSLSLKQP